MSIHEKLTLIKNLQTQEAHGPRHSPDIIMNTITMFFDNMGSYS